MTANRDQLREICQLFGAELYRPARNQLHFVVRDAEELHGLCQQLRAEDFYLVSAVANDERELEDQVFKIYYLFSHPTGDILLLSENPLQPGAENYDSVYRFFASVDPFERQAADLFGLFPGSPGRQIKPGSWLHDIYPPTTYPLRRDQTPQGLKEAIEAYRRQPIAARHGPNGQPPPDGEWLLPVGPVHAGVIEPGQFLFRLAGEVVEEITLRLGYTHKGIERLFQTNYTMADGWRLAEHVSGDSSFAHSLAYCQAAEALAGVYPPAEAGLLRGLFLELERMANHIGDCGALAHDVAYAVAASDLAALRERLLELNHHLAGQRLLRGLNRPGGLVLGKPLDIPETRETVRETATQFSAMAHSLAQWPPFRDRLQWTGILTRRQALDLGATGLVARASGVRRDFRLQHPVGAYQDQTIQELVKKGLPPDDDSIEGREASAGDALARFLIRAREVDSSAEIIQYILDRPELNTQETCFVTPTEFRPEHNFEFGLGYVEGWRGDIVYWLMQDKFGGIYRCMVRDPSLLNWPALKAVVEPHRLDDDYRERHKPPGGDTDSIVPDFPVINKSFNLSYSGNDL
jgi:Ni,Fe-hydrogenase III large subunit/Ni,Fe-hydrogenase III component G